MEPTAFETAISALDFGAFVSTYLTVAGVALPVVIAIMATKEGYRWLMGFIGRA